MKSLVLWLCILCPVFGWTQDEDAEMLRKIHETTLSVGKSYDWLRELCVNYPGRLAGSEADLGASLYTLDVLNTLGLDTAYRQECQALYWKRGKVEQVFQVMKDGGLKPLNAVSLGRGGSTREQGITAEVIEVKSLDELSSLPGEKVAGKIVFFNRPMDPSFVNTFRAYGGAVDQRVYGPSRAQKKGAVAALVRSMTLRKDDNPHTGVTVFDENQPKIPAMALSTNDADMLSSSLSKGAVYVFINTNCTDEEAKPTYNVIGEIRGSEFPNEIILVGGHLDSWDIGQGAHDDGSGCVQSMEVLNILQKMAYVPKRTIRCVLFANEENGLAGGLQYAKISNEKGEFHLAALESDAGGFTPKGFSFEGDTSVFKTYYKQINQWSDFFNTYGLQFDMGGSGADISPLKSQKGLLIGLRPDSQKYFDYHHTKIDTIDAVHDRELKLGAAAMTSLVYFIDNYGLQPNP
ncbi:MAG: M28 family peptidase [Saprospiraceae bacterium]|nr:M28 family peptidase [Saprospiraceae bacterium]MBK8547420.1 M28 family peptidase [Saprospiraceae bacterium]MBK8818633.1 M28 family peptidase [Saprospiraceae bacterium]MBK8852764.1 M28 family peptidase [Saprospiraceae bacterium]MBK9042410.1 M28 family peptidase [Saprospiraceae bacterium]